MLSRVCISGHCQSTGGAIHVATATRYQVREMALETGTSVQAPCLQMLTVGYVDPTLQHLLQ